MKSIIASLFFVAFALGWSSAQAQEKDIVCTRGQPCEVTLDLSGFALSATSSSAPILESRQEKTETSSKEVSPIVKYGLLPAAMGLAGGGFAGLAFPDDYNGETNSFSYGAGAKGVAVGIGAGVLLGLLVDILDG